MTWVPQAYWPQQESATPPREALWRLTRVKKAHGWLESPKPWEGKQWRKGKEALKGLKGPRKFSGLRRTSSELKDSRSFPVG